jgi:hypothetical protein
VALPDVALDGVDVVRLGVDAGPAVKADVVEVGFDGLLLVAARFRGLGGAAVRVDKRES